MRLCFFILYYVHTFIEYLRQVLAQAIDTAYSEIKMAGYLS